MDLPRMIRIKQKFESRALSDIPRAISEPLKRLEFEDKTRPGQSVALACSSRGIANYGVIVRSLVSSLKELGLEPFVVPAMGSHGSATAAGQKKVLENLGLAEEKICAPICSSLEVVQIGETSDQIPVYIDKLAFEADYIIPINRIKRHTDFEHEIESGLLKLLTIGLGKQKGAETYHPAILEQGYPTIISSVARKVLETGKILFGVGIVEDAFAQTASINILLPEEIEKREKELLKIAKEMTPGLPFDDVDILVIDEMGKEINGSGFDTKVVGRINLPLVSKEPEKPRVKRIVVCDLTEKTEGNAAGVGNADLITRRLADKIDGEATNMNCLSGCGPEAGRIPITMKNDREAIEMAIRCVGMIPNDKLRLIRIKNTLRLDEVEVSSAFKEELRKRQDLEALTEERPISFDDQGNLEPFFQYRVESTGACTCFTNGEGNENKKKQTTFGT